MDQSEGFLLAQDGRLAVTQLVEGLPGCLQQRRVLLCPLCQLPCTNLRDRGQGGGRWCAASQELAGDEEILSGQAAPP